jgi:hypothetical protein
MIGNWLTGSQQGQLVQALLQAYSLDQLDLLLLHRLNVVRENIAIGNNARTIVARVVDEANKKQWADRLLGAALDENPRQPDLLRFKQQVGLGSARDLDRQSLQKVIHSGASFVDVAAFLHRLAAIEVAVCQLAVPWGGGTGTLVGADLVLTNHHVMAAVLDQPEQLARVRCIFDFKRSRDGRTVDAGRPVALDATWTIPWSRHADEDVEPERGDPPADRLDCAILKLDQPVGSQPLGSLDRATPVAETRGWIDLTNPAPVPAPGQPLLVVQHPQLPDRPSQEPMQLTLGAVLPGPAHRLRHDAATHPGASGSLCFDAALRPVALHHLGDPNSTWQHKPTYNQGIPIDLIVAWAKQQGIELATPPATDSC